MNGLYALPTDTRRRHFTVTRAAATATTASAAGTAAAIERVDDWASALGFEKRQGGANGGDGRVAHTDADADATHCAQLLASVATFA